MYLNDFIAVLKTCLLCSPELVPQMVGGLGPSSLLTLKVSVRHWPRADTGMVPAASTTPEFATRLATVLASAFGPVITKFSKSSRSCKKVMLLLYKAEHLGACQVLHIPTNNGTNDSTTSDRGCVKFWGCSNQQKYHWAHTQL